MSAPVSRPVQLAMLGGTDKSVGRLITSVVAGSNADLIAAVAPLYLQGSVLDVTYGRGMWWRRFTPDPFGCHDLALDGVDFRALPYGPATWDAVCFDPPYVPRQGAAAAPHARDQAFRDRYGLEEPRTDAELKRLMAAGLAECARVARRFVLVKCNDYTNGRRFHLGHIRVLEEAAQLGWHVHDLFVHVSRAGPGGGHIQTQRRARRAHSYLLVLTQGRYDR